MIKTEYIKNCCCLSKSKSFSIILTLLSVIVGFSRVYVGHHYTMDVIGAYMIVFATNYSYNMKIRSKVEDLYRLIEKKLATWFGFKELYN